MIRLLTVAVWMGGWPHALVAQPHPTGEVVIAFPGHDRTRVVRPPPETPAQIHRPLRSSTPCTMGSSGPPPRGAHGQQLSRLVD